MKYVLLVMFSFLLMAMTCRKVDRSTTNVKENSDSLSLAIKIRQYDSLYKETELLKKTILELKSQGAKFEQPKVDTAAIKKMFEGFGCPPSKVDSILKVLTTANAKIKILKNGTVEMEGLISEFYQTSSRYEETIQIRERQIEEFSNTIDSLTVVVEKERSEKSKDVHKDPVFPWWWVVVAFIAGGLLVYFGGKWYRNKSEELSDKRAIRGF